MGFRGSGIRFPAVLQWFRAPNNIFLGPQGAGTPIHQLHNVPTVVILEDAESTLSDGNSTQSSVLNFLDGVDQPSNKNGAYILMTTNHPERIEDRVLRRPGRIDRIFQVGPLKSLVQLHIQYYNCYYIRNHGGYPQLFLNLLNWYYNYQPLRILH